MMISKKVIASSLVGAIALSGTMTSFAAEAKEKMMHSYNAALVLKNVSDTQPLAPGAIVVHEKDLDLDFVGRKIDRYVADKHDAGFEENTQLGSGFEGGQPDPSKGEANLTNGTATQPQANVTIHDQLTDDLLIVELKKSKKKGENLDTKVKGKIDTVVKTLLSTLNKKTSEGKKQALARISQRLEERKSNFQGNEKILEILEYIQYKLEEQ